MKPRERVGQDSIANAAPAGHSAPMPMPSKVRKISRKMKVGEKPAMKLQNEYHRMEIISGHRAADAISQPARRGGADQAHPQRQREDDGDFGDRDFEFVGDRHR